MEYFPYVFLAFLTSIIAMFYSFIGKFIFKEGDIDSINTYHDEERQEKSV